MKTCRFPVTTFPDWFLDLSPARRKRLLERVLSDIGDVSTALDIIKGHARISIERVETPDEMNGKDGGEQNEDQGPSDISLSAFEW